MATSYRPRPVSEIVSDLYLQTTTLVRKEVQLARAETSENIATVGRALGMVVGGAILLIPALVILLQAGVAALVERNGLSTALSALIVGGVVLILGLILLLIGISRLKVDTMIPSRTVNQLQRDASVANQQVSDNHEQRRAA